MDIVSRAKNILMNPKKEWEVIKNEDLSVSDMFTQYAIFLAAIPAVAGFIGNSIVGFSILGSHFRVPFGKGFTSAVLGYILALVGVYVLGLIIDALAPTFGAQKDSKASFKTALYAMTASWIGGIFLIIPALSVLSMIAGIYSLYILFLGVKTVKEPPQEKLNGYFIACIVAAVIIFVVINVILSGMMFSGGMSSFNTFA